MSLLGFVFKLNLKETQRKVHNKRSAMFIHTYRLYYISVIKYLHNMQYLFRLFIHFNQLNAPQSIYIWKNMQNDLKRARFIP